MKLSTIVAFMAIAFAAACFAGCGEVETDTETKTETGTVTVIEFPETYKTPVARSVRKRTPEKTEDAPAAPELSADFQRCGLVAFEGLRRRNRGSAGAT